MRLLYITPYVPSPIRVRPYELIRALIDHGAQLTLLCPSEREDTAALRELREWGVIVHDVPITTTQRLPAVLRGALAGQPLQAAFGAPAALRRRLIELVATERFDVVHLEHLRAAALLPLVQHLPVVYDAVDCISLLFERTRRSGPDWRSRQMAGFELARTRDFERRTCLRARVTTVTSAEDAAALQALAPDATFRIVPNGVDLQRFTPGAWPRAADVIVFTGKMSYHANIAAAQRLITRIMPRVWRERPAAQLWIVGSNPPRTIQRAAGDPRIIVTGRVPDVAPYVQQATVAVSPLCYGVGVQNKVLEAMGTATPMVADRQCLTALQAQPDRDLLVADDDQQFAATIVHVINDPALQQQLGRAGRCYVEQAHQWSRSATTLISAYVEALAAPKPVTIHRLYQPEGVLP